MDANTIHIVRAALQDRAAVFREIELPSQKTLVDLAKGIVIAFGFNFDHAFGFYSQMTGRNVLRSNPAYELFADMGEDTEAKSVKRTRIAEAFPAVGHKMLFLFDYGDDWRFTVEVIAVGEKAPKTRYPKILKQVGAAREQYPAEEDDAGDCD